MDNKNTIYLGQWALILAIFWLLLSGYLKSLLVIFGIISVALCVYVIKAMNDIDGEKRALNFGTKMISYIAWLMCQVVTSSLHVAKLVWGSTKNLSPSIAKLPVSDLPDDTRVIYANSITLTPGTLSVDLDNNEVTVHALHEESIEHLKQGAMTSKIKNTFKGAE